MPRATLATRYARVTAIKAAIPDGITAKNWGLTEEQWEAYDETLTPLNAVWSKATHPDTRTKTVIAARNQALKVAEAAASVVRAIAKVYPNLTDEQRTAINIPIPHSVHPKPAPTMTPSIAIASTQGRVMNLIVRDSAEATKNRKPPGIAGANLFVAFDELPTTATGWQWIGATTKARTNYIVPENIAPGTKVFFVACWYNAKAETGPASSPAEGVTQYGAVTVPSELDMSRPAKLAA
jgi:hypothetical protein